jgi:hypothetical protein
MEKAVHLLGALVVTNGFKELLSTGNIVDSEGERIVEGVLDVRARSEVHHTVNVVVQKNLGEGRLIRNVALHKSEVGQRVQAVDIGQRSDNIELVKADDMVFGVLHRHVAGYPTSTKSYVSDVQWGDEKSAHINPAPPVIKILLMSLRGSNRVVPMRR